MLKLLSLSALAFAVSLDSFGVGVTYGLRSIRIPWPSIVVVTGCSALLMIISMHIGIGLMSILPLETIKLLGPTILIGVGTFTLWQLLRQKEDRAEEHTDQEKTLIKLEIRAIGLVIHILKKPTVADVDRSGVISPIEAAFLGIALSLDSFAAGFGAAMVGFSPWLAPLLIAFLSGLFLACGLRFGRWANRFHWLRKVVYLPGVLLILIGIMKMW